VDVGLLVRVVWRFKLLVLGGVVAAIVLATLSYTTVRFDGGAPTFTYRDNQQWESLSTIFVTSRGFPWGSAFDPNAQVINPDGTVAMVPQLSTTRLSGLAALYQEYATSDGVYQRLARRGPINGFLRTYSVFPGGDGSAPPLPMMTLSAVSTTPESARALNGRWLKAVIGYITIQQTRAQIPAEKRAVLQVIREPQRATLLTPRKKTRPILVFLTVMTAVIGLAFIFENLRPRVRALPAENEDAVARPEIRRSA
jgi:hypothetical protein